MVHITLVAPVIYLAAFGSIKKVLSQQHTLSDDDQSNWSGAKKSKHILKH